MKNTSRRINNDREYKKDATSDVSMSSVPASSTPGQVVWMNVIFVRGGRH